MQPLRAQGAAEAAQPPLQLAVFVSSRTDLCFDNGNLAAITRLARLERDRINQGGGIGGRRLEIAFIDDARDAQRAITGTRAALTNPNTLAMIGQANSERAKAMLDALGKEIRASGIPFLSDLSVNTLFAAYPNIYTTRASQDDERLPVMTEFTRQAQKTRPAFLGIKDAVFSTALGDGLVSSLGEDKLVADHRLPLTGGRLAQADIAKAIADLKEKNADLVFLNVGGARTGEFLQQMKSVGFTPPLFITGRIDAIPAEITKAYPNDLYQLAWDELPDVYSDRLRKLISPSQPAEWVFAGRKVAEAPGWSKGECKPRAEEEQPNPLATENLRAIGFGAQYADMVALVAAAARSAATKSDTAKLRAHVLRELATSYAAGRGAFQGRFENWSFRTASRAAARTPFIVRLPAGLGRTQLAPVQFVRLRNDALRAIDTLYLDIDMIRMFRVDDNEKSFFAEFYLSMRDDGKGASIEALEFANAFLDPKSNDRQITIRTLNKGGRSAAYPDDMKIYQVAGKFMFEPQLGSYPFDVQRFSIDLRPRSGEAPFIIQPPPHPLRDKAVATDGWEPQDHFIGVDADFVPTSDARTHAQSIVPFYKASFVWVMKRQTTDYYLRVVVPLGFILFVAYMSIFIPLSHFEAIVTIQVTALLSAVALYLALPKVDADATTLSDRIFLFNYMAVSLMIGLSVLRINRLAAGRAWLKASLAFLHITMVPVLVAAMAIYVYRASVAGS